jgi:hypothetical protein
MRSSTRRTFPGAAVALILLPALVTSARGQGTPRLHQDGTTHWYEPVAVPAGITWQAANLAAHAAGGYLATITSSQENDFAFGLIDQPAFWHQDGGPWIGGVQAFRSQEPDGGWIWGELEAFGFSNWAPGLPDDAGRADRIHFGGGSGRQRTWADAPAGRRLGGYVIERSGPTVPRTVGLLQRESASFDGYTLLAPINSTSTFLLDPRGRVVNDWPSTYLPGISAYLLPNGNLLRTGRVINEKFLIGGSGGIVEERTWQGQLVWSRVESSPTSCQHHDVRRLPNGNTLLLCWELKTRQDAFTAGRDPQLLTNGELFPDKVIEVDAAGAVVWEWHAWDHLIQDRDPTKANYGPVAAHPELIDLNYPPPGRVGSGINDWMHSNAVTYNARLDQVMISVRHFNELWIIDHSTTSAEAAGHTGGRSGRGGDILYRWGNPEAYRAGSPGDRQFFQQHDAQWIDHDLPGGGNILVFDNGLERPSPAFSRVVEITPPTPDTRGNYPRPTPNWGPALPTWTFQAPAFYSMFVGGAQRLPNGNTLVCSGWQGVSFEVTPQGRIVWKYACPMRSTPLLQGSVPASNQMFRTPRYAPDYAAFAGRNLTPGDPIELQDTVLLADGSSTRHVVTAGTHVSLAVRSAADGGRIYFVATSATSGLIGIDWRFLRIGYDPLLFMSLGLTNARPFVNYFGILDAAGRAEATLAIPAMAGLSGTVLHSTYFVYDPAGRGGIGTIGNDAAVLIDR